MIKLVLNSLQNLDKVRRETHKSLKFEEYKSYVEKFILFIFIKGKEYSEKYP